jgi:membrane fusion protein (multidrug efflux system)
MRCAGLGSGHGPPPRRTFPVTGAHKTTIGSMKNLAAGALAAIVVAAAVGAGYWFGTHRAAAPDGARMAGIAPTMGGAKDGAPGGAGNAVTVEAVRVAVVSLPQTITAVGSLRSDESVTLRPEVAGRISAIGFQEGQRVAKGALLIQLDAAVPQAEVEQARANFTLAKTKYDRAVDLARSNFISSQAKDEAENNLKIAQAGLQLVEAKLAKMQIRAPFSGIIGLRVVSIGDYVKEGADLVNLESIDPLKVDFRVPEIYMRQVQAGQSLQIQLDALPGRTFGGRVLAVNPLVDAAGRVVVIRAVVRNPDTTLRPGMFARVRLITKDVEDALVVPEQALVPQGDQQYVYRIVDGKAVRTRVEVGQRRDAKVELVSGVAKDDLVVVAGQLKLRDGVPVAIAGGEAGNGAPANAENAPPPQRKS